MTDDNETRPDDLLARTAELDKSGYYPYLGEVDLDPYRDLLAEYEPAEIVQAFKANDFSTPSLHQNMDVLLLAVIDDGELTSEFMEATRWYE